jgi:hypothetical protein
LLSRHTLISGINGSGKTNTIQAILNQLGELPFLVIEPAKTEYVDWALEYNKAHPESPISIYIPGCKKYKGTFDPKPLKLNPFEIVWLKPEQEVNVLTHIDRLKSTFAAAFPMYDILPVLMEDLIYTVYQNKSTDWLNVFDNFVGDDIAHAEAYKTMEATDAFRIMNKRIHDYNQAKLKAHGK